MAVHRAAKLTIMPGLQHTVKRKVRSVDPLLDDDYRLTKEDVEAMPDPAPLLPAIATMVIEVIAGTRSLDHMSNLVSEQVYDRLRSKIHQRTRPEAGARPPLMPKFAVGKIRTDSPSIGVIESVVLINTQQRTRAVAIRLEPIHKRWRATSVSVL